jgi:hypothetical protein
MDRLDSANVARVVARMDAIAAAQAHPIAVQIPFIGAFRCSG